MNTNSSNDALTSKLAGSMMGRLCLGAAFGIHHAGTAIGVVGGLTGKGIKFAGDMISVGGEVIDGASQKAKGYCHDKAGDLRKSGEEYLALVDEESGAPAPSPAPSKSKEMTEEERIDQELDLGFC